MRPAHVIEIRTPKRVMLSGLWFGPAKASRAIIWVHGLGSSAFSKLDIVEKLVDRTTAVLTFNNRGHDTVAHVPRFPARTGDPERVLAGAAHEVFTESVDDIQGAIDFARSRGATRIFLAGHSTGCQKSVYYATRKGNAGKIDGVILLAPISDYASAMHHDPNLQRQVAAARKLMRDGRKQAIVPGSWADAQRVISLYTPESAEEIFSYSAPEKVSRTYRAHTVPTLVLFAENDQYADRPADAMADWFRANSRSERYEAHIIRDADHSFKGAENQVAKVIRQWISP